MFCPLLRPLTRRSLAAAATKHLFSNRTSRAASSCQALVLKKYGQLDDKEVLELQDIPLPNMESEDVIVEMLRSPIHPADINLIQGVYPMKPQLPSVPGGEGVGTVREVGKAVDSLQPGDHVILTMPGIGTWRTHIVTGAQHFIKIPQDIPLNLASNLMVNPQTAYRMLSDFVILKPGDCVIQNSANSGVGQSVIQIAAAWGIKTINIIRNRPNLESIKDQLFSMGASEVVTEEFASSHQMKELVEKYGRPVLGLNGVGGPSATNIMKQLAPHSVMVTYGGMSREPVTVSTGNFIFKDLQLRGYWNNKWLQVNVHSTEHKKMVSDISKLAVNGQLIAPPCTEYLLADYQTAIMRAMEPYIGSKQMLILNK